MDIPSSGTTVLLTRCPLPGGTSVVQSKMVGQWPVFETTKHIFQTLVCFEDPFTVT
jgi:hypothetical protein